MGGRKLDSAQMGQTGPIRAPFAFLLWGNIRETYVGIEEQRKKERPGWEAGPGVQVQGIEGVGAKPVRTGRRLASEKALSESHHAWQ